MSDPNQIETHIPRLRRYARALSGDRMQADDLVQETLARAWQKFSLWRRDTDLRAWLFTIMHNVFINDLRRQKRRPEFFELDDVTHEAAQADANGDGLMLRDLERALQRLPTDQRAILLLVSLEEMSYQEIAHSLEIPIGTVMSRLARARERLRTQLDGTGPALRRVK